MTQIISQSGGGIAKEACGKNEKEKGKREKEGEYWTGKGKRRSEKIVWIETEGKEAFRKNRIDGDRTKRDVQRE